MSKRPLCTSSAARAASVAFVLLATCSWASAADAPPKPATPSGVHAQFQEADRLVRITWQAVGGARSYTVEKSEDGQHFVTVAVLAAGDGSAAAGTTSFDDRGVELHHLYKYRVTAVDQAGRKSDPSSPPASATAGATFNLLAPNNGEAFHVGRKTPPPPFPPALSWQPLTGAASYQVRVSRADDPTDPILVTGPLSKTDFSLAKEAAGISFGSGDKYQWNVVADPDGAAAPSANGPFTFSSPSFFQRLNDYGFHFQRSYAPGGEQAGQFKYQHSAIKKPGKSGANDTWGADGALIWEGRTSGDPIEATPVASVEAHVSNQADGVENALIFRGGYEFDTSAAGHYVNQTYTSAVIKYEADRNMRAEKLMAEVLFTPSITDVFRSGPGGPRVDFGTLFPGAGGHGETHPPLALLLRPYVGFDLGHTLDDQNVSKERNTVARLLFKGRAQLELNYLTDHGFHGTEMFVFVDDTYYCLLAQDGMTPNLFTAGYEWDLTANVSLTVTYKVGHDEPTFHKVESISAGIGLKF